MNETWPATYALDTTYVIDKLDILDVKINGTTELLIKKDENARLLFKSQTDKSCYIELEYKDINVNGTGLDKDHGKWVDFITYNQRLNNDASFSGKKLFNSTKVDKVLLPNSADVFVVYLQAHGADFKITVVASDSILGKAVGFLVAAMALMVAFAF